MFTKSKLDRYRELELIPADHPLTPSRGWNRWVAFGLIRRWLRDLAIAPSTPRIRRGIDNTGALYWQVHDPATGDHARLYDETDVRIWLEHRYRHRSRSGSTVPSSSTHRFHTPLGY